MLFAHVMLWYHLYNFKNVKKRPCESVTFTKSNGPPVDVLQVFFYNSTHKFIGRWNSGSCYNAAQLLPSFCSCEGKVIVAYTKYNMQGLLQKK